MWRECIRGCPGGAERAERSGRQAAAADVGQLLCGSGTSVGPLCVWGTPRGRGGQGNVFRSAVILHNAGQIRLELTAEDIQLDCSCHSVASIRVSPDAFVFAIAARENTARSVFLCHFHLCRPLAPVFFIILVIECYMLNIDITRPCKFLIYIVGFSDAITLSDLKNPSGLR